MTHALNKLAAWLATVVVAGMVLLVSSAAQAHVSHGGKSFGSVTAVEVLAVTDSNVGRPVPALRSTAREANFWIADTGGRTDYVLPSAETSCCGDGVSACSTGALAHVPTVILNPQFCTTDNPFGAAALMGVTVDGLIRPPRVTTL